MTEIDRIWSECLTVLTEAVHDLDTDKLSEESFNSFRAILQIGMEVTREIGEKAAHHAVRKHAIAHGTK